MSPASSVPSENSRHFATASLGFPQPRPQGAFLQSQEKAPQGRGWVSREIKPVMGSRNVVYFLCQALQTSLPHPTSMFFLSKKTCRNTIGSPATRNQCESHRAQNSVKISIVFRTWNDSGWGRALHWELFAIWVNPSENFHGGGVPSILNVKFKLNPRCDHLVRTFFAANLFARYCSYLSIYPTAPVVQKEDSAIHAG